MHLKQKNKKTKTRSCCFFLQSFTFDLASEMGSVLTRKALEPKLLPRAYLSAALKMASWGKEVRALLLSRPRWKVELSSSSSCHLLSSTTWASSAVLSSDCTLDSSGRLFHVAAQVTSQTD